MCVCRLQEVCLCWESRSKTSASLDVHKWTPEPLGGASPPPRTRRRWAPDKPRRGRRGGAFSVGLRCVSGAVGQQAQHLFCRLLQRLRCCCCLQAQVPHQQKQVPVSQPSRSSTRMRTRVKGAVGVEAGPVCVYGMSRMLLDNWSRSVDVRDGRILIKE